MLLAQARDAIVQHYLEIQALSPVAGQVDQKVAQNPVLIPQLSVPLIILLIGFCASIIWLLFRRYHVIKKAIIAAILLVGLLPFTLDITTQKTRLSSQAQNSPFPQAVTLDLISHQGVVVSWWTDKPVVGGVKVSLTPTMDRLVKIVRDPQPTQKHTTYLYQLSPGKTYYLHVLSRDLWYDDNAQPIMLKLPE